MRRKSGQGRLESTCQSSLEIRDKKKFWKEDRSYNKKGSHCLPPLVFHSIEADLRLLLLGEFTALSLDLLLDKGSQAWRG